LGKKLLNKWHITIYQQNYLNALTTFMHLFLWAFALRVWRFLPLLLNVKGSCSYFRCWRFLLLFFDVKGYCFYSWMLNVLIFCFRCWKFLFLLLDIESFCFYFWILKVITFVLGCWRFLLLFLNVEVFCFWMLKVFTFILGCRRFVILGLLFICIYIKKNDAKIYSILFKSWLYKFSLIYNDERFMKGGFLMIIMLHMFCFVWTFVMTLLFLCYRVELSLCFNLLTSKLYIQDKILSKAIIWFYLQVYKL
jgi:hypothetical protein